MTKALTQAIPGCRGVFPEDGQANVTPRVCKTDATSMFFHAPQTIAAIWPRQRYCCQG